MDFLVRKITKSKWTPAAYLQRLPHWLGDIKLPANEISLWECENTPSDIDEVVLALMANKEVASVDSIDLLIFSKQELIDAGFTFDVTPGETLVEDLRTRHKDLILGGEAVLYLFADLVLSKINSVEVQRVSRSHIIEILRRAVESRRLEKNGLANNVQKLL